ncbi:ABC transporter permease subunit [Bacillaceae bacterium SIJ1]|uniref:ABC transporter permease n=1 Tax=Litoribacterium kuwaitense TaxID=1398745 RepID=UPI0013ECD08D|nr:ABC transporter permease [Litoribacterium kuwaitense]NGP43863.1 ABC transporter permease subunit [Litoribacterium kuwaitense]
MWKCFKAEWLKTKRHGLWILLFLGPAGVIGLESLNFLLRYDWLTHIYEEHLWQGVLWEVSALAVPSILLGACLLTSILASVEHQGDQWKQLYALPLFRWRLYLAKWLVSICLMLLAGAGLAVGTYILGGTLGFGWEKAPLVSIVTYSFFPILGAMPVLSLQLWLSVAIKNQALPLVVGSLGMIVGMSMREVSFVFWGWPRAVMIMEDKQLMVLTMAVSVSMIILFASLIYVSKKEVSS